MTVRHYQELVAWQKAMDLAHSIFSVTRAFPRDELFGLTSQLRRAVVSIPSNIAEGQGRNTTGEFIQFLGHAAGSLQEVETQLLLATRFGYLTQSQNEPLMESAAEVSRLISGFARSLKRPG